MKISEINLNNVLLGHVAGAPVQHKKSGLPQIAFAGRSLCVFIGIIAPSFYLYSLGFGLKHF